jgi:isocitrate dehydrogenase
MKPSYNGVTVPPNGKAIEFKPDGAFHVPDHPVIPFIEGDGTGRDIWKASRQVFDAAVAKSYGGKRKIEWLEIFAGEKAFKQFNNWLPDETVEAIRDFRVVFRRRTLSCKKSGTNERRDLSREYRGRLRRN